MPRKNPQDYTSIHVTKKLTQELNKLGDRGESYEHIIRRIIGEWKRKH